VSAKLIGELMRCVVDMRPECPE